MASTSQLLTWIELECHGWNREGPRGSRALFNEAHNMLLLGEDEENILYDSSTGNLPYITTTQGTYLYTFPATVWRVGAVLVDDATYVGTYYSLTDEEIDQEWQLEEFRLGGRFYYKVKNIRSAQYRNANSLSSITFTIDPGDTTDVFRRLAYRLPTQITSDTVQHEVPPPYDMECLLPATMRLIDAINDHQKMEEARKYIMEVLRPKIKSGLSAGEQGSSSYSVKRAF